jgi:hypothetical protein
MPYQVTNPDSLLNTFDYGRHEYRYDYPDGLDLKPGSDLHQKIISRLLRYGWESARIMADRRPVWDSMNDKLTAFIEPTEKERLVKLKDPRKPISIVFPYSYAILETLVSYMCTAFFPEPMFRYEGMGPEDVGGALLLEKVINLHVIRNKIALNLHTMFRDASAYGIGVVTPQWQVKRGIKIRSESLGLYDAQGMFSETGKTRVVSEGEVLFEGNALLNIDPYGYLPDPNFPIHEVQRGEYVGWLDRAGYMDLLSEERVSEDELFNVRYLRHVNNKTSNILGEKGLRNRRITDPSHNRNVSDPIDLFHVYVKLIPSDWNIGKSKYPEKWLFTVAGDAVIIRAKPLGLHHDSFPVAVTAPDFDGYSPIAYSRLEILQGMQVVIDWLFNSHIANVRKAINDMLIVDPYLLNIEDLRDPEPGAIVRTRRPAWGRGVENSVKQLAITDITARNMQDVSLIIQYMQQVSGTDNPIMGNLRKGGPERLTSAEYKGTTQGAISRLERIARVIGLQGMQDIGYQFAYNTQQFMSEEVYVRTVGEWPETIKKQFSPQGDRVLVSPYDVLVDYDLLVRDGSIPGGNFNESWIDLFKTIGESELLIQRFDIVRIFKYIATQLGAKNVDDFEIGQAKIVPDEQVEQQSANGNLVELLGARA